MINSYIPKPENQNAPSNDQPPIILGIFGFTKTSRAKKKAANPKPIKVEPLTICRLKGFNLKNIFNKNKRTFINNFLKKVRLMPNDYSINPPFRYLRLRITYGRYTSFLFQKVASTLLAWLNISLPPLRRGRSSNVRTPLSVIGYADLKNSALTKNEDTQKI
mgnify:CR=1 FL=1